MAIVLVVFVALTQPLSAERAERLFGPFPDPTGQFATISSNAEVDPDHNPFFQSLGTNGRSCVTCHQPDDGWTVTPTSIQRRFEATQGTDPIFRTNDGSDCATSDVSTVSARRSAYGMLLAKGLIRVGLGVPANAEFVVLDADNPHGCSSIAELSLYRRPLPSTNLTFLSTVMWDGRETTSGAAIRADLISQARNATLGHAQAGESPTDDQLDAIVDFETGLYTAQVRDHRVGPLDALGATGGPRALSTQPFFIGINDPLGLNPTHAPFDPVVFTIFSAWARGERGDDKARAAVARGETLFNTRPIVITGVSGLNDETGQDVIIGTCGTCHDTPNVGNHSVSAPLDIGLADASRRTPDLPLYTVRCTTTGEVTQVTDLGRAMITGRCKDIGRFKGAILRGLSARAPYFHNGSAATLRDVVRFYDERFGLGLSEGETADLVAFLASL